MKFRIPVLVAALLCTAAGTQESNMKLSSSAFAENGAIPARHTCEGDDQSPPLAWSDAPPGTRSYALIVDDPDAPDPAAPKRTWVHWLVYDIPAEAKSLGAGLTDSDLPKGALAGRNDFRRTAYGGPCPPIGKHRYFHKLYALDTLLPDLKEPDKAKLEQAMQGHILAQAQLIGTYEKKK